MGAGSEDQPGQDRLGQDPFSQAQPGSGHGGQDQFGQGPAMPPPPFGAPGASGQAGPGQFGQGAGMPPPPYGPPGAYGQPSAGWPQMAGRRTNSLAIAALCCGIGQAIAGPLAGIAAIVLGAMSLKQIRVSGEEGRGMATTGLVLGIVGLILFVFFMIFAIAVFHGITTDFSNLNNPNG